MKLRLNKKAIGIALGVTALVAVAGGGVLTYVGVSKQFEAYELALAMRDGKLETFTQKLEEIGGLTTCYELNYDVKGGTIIAETDLTPVEIPEKAAAGYVQNINDVLGRYYKTGLGQGTILGESMVLDYVLDGDLRYLDVIVDEIPIGLDVGSYVDIRFRFTFGQNMLAMSHKQVVGINENVLKLVVDERDIHSYESIQKDKAQYVGCKVSAIEYVEGGIQNSGLNYYPLRLDVMSTMVQDPNIKEKEDLSQFTMVDRLLLEDQLITMVDLNGNGETLEEQIKRIYAESIQTGEEELKKAYESAVKYYNTVEAGAELSGTASVGGDAYDPYEMP